MAARALPRIAARQIQTAAPRAAVAAAQSKSFPAFGQGELLCGFRHLRSCLPVSCSELRRVRAGRRLGTKRPGHTSNGAVMLIPAYLSWSRRGLFQRSFLILYQLPPKREQASPVAAP